MPPTPVPLPTLPTPATLRLTPTDVSQFVRLEQCERFLRLRLAERSGVEFMAPSDVAVHRVTPLRTLSGESFESTVETDLCGRFRSVHFAELANRSHARPANNTAVLTEARNLKPGESVVLFQTRLEVELAGWRLRGDVDLIKLTRSVDGAFDILVTDLKATAAVKVEHRLQVAFYRLMLETLLTAGSVAVTNFRTAILYRLPVDPTLEEEADAAPLREAARAEFGLDGFLLELVMDPDAYIQSAHDLVLGADSTARRIAASELDTVPYSLSFKCDDCLYTEFCMKWSAQTEDLSLLPYMTGTEKDALRRHGIETVASLASLKEFAPAGEDGRSTDLVPAPGREAQVRQLAATWPVGPRLDELVHRARSFRRSVRNDGTKALSFIPNRGNSSLPVTRPDLNPNLVWLYVDTQADSREGRVYLVGALVVACRDGVPVARKSVVRMTDGPPDSSSKERELFAGWTRDLLTTVLELAQPAGPGDGPRRAPIHVVFFDRHEQRLLLDALARNSPAILERTPPLYDFLTQLAAFDSPIASFLDEEVRTFKNFPMTCQSLQSLATFLKFDWNTPHRFRELFRERLFDYLGTIELEGEPEWYTRRSRFASSIPLEYAYAAWGQLPAPGPGRGDEFANFRAATPELVTAFQVRRLEAIEHVTRSIAGNPNTEKTSFVLPELAGFEDKAHDLAHALDEFVTIERLVELADWKRTRHAQPEQRVLMGETLLVRYCEADQDPPAAEQNREHERRRLKYEEYAKAFRDTNPDKPVKLSKEQRNECSWSPEGLRLRLRVETEGIDCDLNEALLLSNLRDGTQVILFQRWTVDERLPADRQVEFTPTPKQMLYGQRAVVRRIDHHEKDPVTGRTTLAFVEVELKESRGNEHTRPFAFGGFKRPLVDGRLYTLDPCPNSWLAYWCSRVVKGLCAGSPNALYDRLASTPPSGDGAGFEGQKAFLAGLESFHATGLLHDFEPGKREFIGGHADTPILLVQGPPGTGKSYSTAFAIFARIQGALRAGRDCRVFLSCKTHAATDVLLNNVREVREILQKLRRADPERFARHFDPRLLDVPLYRVAPKSEPPDGVIVLGKDDDQESDEASPADAIRESRWAVVAITPGGTYRMLKQRFKEVFGHELCDLLVLDEASQMSLPEAVLAALPLSAEAPIIVVGDHRQMPPIVKHDWDAEARRTFRQYQVYQSLFDTLRTRSQPPPMIRFAESFRLHRAMAEFLRQEVYRHDGIHYHSNQMQLLPATSEDDPFLAAVLDPAYPLIVVVHDECASQVRNPFEQELISPVIRVLADPARHGLDPVTGLGVVVPHRSQRAALQQALADPVVSGAAAGLACAAVDTVERFQGGERVVVLVSATESDRAYLLTSAGFLLDPRRLTVAVSRAKRKMILVASRSVFALFSPDEETFANTQMWKNLLRQGCPVRLWEGNRGGHSVAVWGGPGA